MAAIIITMFTMAAGAAEELTQRKMHVGIYGELEFGLSVNVRVVYDKAKAGLIEYKATDNTQKHIRISVVKNRLVCSYDRKRYSAYPIRDMVIYTYGDLSELKITGIGSAQVDGSILKQQPSLIVSGVGNIMVQKVKAESLSIMITGTGMVKINELRLDNNGCLNVENRGVGRIYLGLSGSVANCELSNAGTGRIGLGNKFKAETLNINNRGTGNVRVVGATVTNIGLDLSGVGATDVYNLKAECCQMSISGSGRLTMTGYTETLNINANGAGSVNCTELKADYVDVLSSGIGSVKAYAVKDSHVKKTGFGTVRIAGIKPEDIRQKEKRLTREE